MASMVSILLALLVTFNTSGPITPINPGKTTGNLHISEKPRLGEISKIRLFEPMLIAQKARIISLFRIDFEKSLLVGYYNYRNRYYMPRIGRFLQTDPTGYMDSMNLYQAFGMNPVNFNDPFGADLYCSTVTSYYEGKKYNPNFGMSSVFHSVMTGLAYGVDYMFKRAEEFDNADWGHFGKQTALDIGNFVTLGTLEKTAAQEDLDIGDKIWYFYNELPNRINNAGTLGLLDNLAAEKGNGLEGAGRALYRTLYEASPASNLYTIFVADSSLEEKIRAASLLPSKIAALGMITNPKIGNPNKFIIENEQMGGHALGRHIGKTDANLMLRLMTSKNSQGKITISGASTFSDINIAESVISKTIKMNKIRIQKWLKSDEVRNLVLDYEGNSIIGRGITRKEFLADYGVSDRAKALIILKKVNKSKYFVLTAYPD